MSVTEDERITPIETERLRAFHDHPFKVTDNPEMSQLVESIRHYGILNPLIVRPLPEGVYEIISGHRRKYAAEKLGYRKVPVVIRVLKDEDAVISMVDSNLQRENILPSEKAFAIKMKYDALLASDMKGSFRMVYFCTPVAKQKAPRSDARPCLSTAASLTCGVCLPLQQRRRRCNDILPPRSLGQAAFAGSVSAALVFARRTAVHLPKYPKEMG